MILIGRGVFLPQRRRVSLLRVQLILTSVHFPAVVRNNFRHSNYFLLSLRCPPPPVNVIHTTLVLHYYKSQLKLLTAVKLNTD